MNFLHRFGLLLVVSTLLGACASPGHFEPTPVAKPGNAMVYLYRQPATNPGIKPLYLSYPEVMIDGSSYGFLKYSHYLALELTPGVHKFRLTGLTEHSKWEPKDVDYSIDIKSGEKVFLDFNVEYNTAEMNLLEPGPKYIIRLNRIPESQAVYEIRNTTKTEE